MNIFYRSRRVGLRGKQFDLLKFRTMRPDADGGSPTAASDDPRLTKIGRILRKTKLDELPTLWNLLRGDISIVGPRPDVPEEIFTLPALQMHAVLSVKPGILSPATLWNANEDAMLEGEEDAHAAYCERIKPVKYRLNVWYVLNRTVWLDLKIIIAFLLRFFNITINVCPKELLP